MSTLKRICFFKRWVCTKYAFLLKFCLLSSDLDIAQGGRNKNKYVVEKLIRFFYVYEALGIAIIVLILLNQTQTKPMLFF